MSWEYIHRSVKLCAYVILVTIQKCFSAMCKNISFIFFFYKIQIVIREQKKKNHT